MSPKEPFKWRKAKEPALAPAPKPQPAPARQPPVNVVPAARVREIPPPPASAPQATATGSETGSEPSHDRIAVRAYGLWEAQGRPDGADCEHWHEAERQLRANRG